MTRCWKGIFVASFLLGVALLEAQGATSIVRNLGTIPQADYDVRLAKELYALLQTNPDDPIAAVEAKVKGPAVTHVRFLYDRKQRLLLVLKRTENPQGVFYHRSSYEDTDPQDFQTFLPVRAQKGYPKVSQSLNKAEVVIPVFYIDFPRLSDWP